MPVPRSIGWCHVIRSATRSSTQAQRRVLHHRAGPVRAAVLQQIQSAELDRVHADLARDEVCLRLVTPDDLGNAKAAESAGRRQVGVDLIRIDAQIGNVVRAACGEAGLLRDARPDVCVGSAIPVHLAMARSDSAAGVHGTSNAKGGGVFGRGVELLFHRERDTNRATRDERECSSQGFQLDIELCTESTAQQPGLHLHAVLGPAEQSSDLQANERRALRGGVKHQTVIGGFADGDHRFERHVRDLLRAERMVEHAIGLCEDGLRITVPKAVVQGHVRRLAPGKMLEVGKRAGGPQHVMNQYRVARRGKHFVEHGGQRLVRHDDKACRRFCDVHVRRENDRDGLADVPDFLNRQDGLVVKCRTIVRIGMISRTSWAVTT